MRIQPTYQTIGAEGVGNCMPASIATITGIDLAEIPHFVEAAVEAGAVAVDGSTLEPMAWLGVFATVQGWLTRNGWSLDVVERNGASQLAHSEPVMCLALVMSQQVEGAPHVIVVDGAGRQVWDPQSLNERSYQPDEVLAMGAVTKLAWPPRD